MKTMMKFGVLALAALGLVSGVLAQEARISKMSTAVVEKAIASLDVESDSTADQVSWEKDGVSYSIQLVNDEAAGEDDGETTSLYMSAVFTVDGVTTEKVNQFNAENRWIRLYVGQGEDGEPAVLSEFDVMTASGLTEGALENAVFEWAYMTEAAKAELEADDAQQLRALRPADLARGDVALLTGDEAWALELADDWISEETLTQESLAAVLKDMDIEAEWSEDMNSFAWEEGDMLYTLAIWPVDEEGVGASVMISAARAVSDANSVLTNEMNLAGRWIRAYSYTEGEDTSLIFEFDVMVDAGVHRDTMTATLEAFRESVASAQDSAGMGDGV